MKFFDLGLCIQGDPPFNVEPVRMTRNNPFVDQFSGFLPIQMLLSLSLSRESASSKRLF
jgi:hypothetical protein